MIYKPTNVKIQPHVSLVSWSIRKVIESEHPELGETYHFVGRSIQTRDGRVSSGIVSFDNNLKVGTTGSGRVYSLEGESGRDADGDYVWDVWTNMNKVTKWEDVTEQVVAGTEL